VEKAARKGCRWLCGNEDGGKSEWHSVMECIRVQNLPGTKVKSEQTSYPGASLRENLYNRFQEGMQMTAL